MAKPINRVYARSVALGANLAAWQHKTGETGNRGNGETGNRVENRETKTQQHH